MSGTDHDGRKAFAAPRPDVTQPAATRRMQAPAQICGSPLPGPNGNSEAGSQAAVEGAPLAAAPLACFKMGNVQCEVVQEGALLGGRQVLGSIAWHERTYWIVSAEAAPPPPNLIEILTKRELDIALLLYGGWHAKAIGRRLDISFHTVRVHTARIFAKLHMNNRSELAACVARQRWLAEAPEVDVEGRHDRSR
jgi:DNA-binding CsgD family transcriptional regulator